MMTLRMSLQKNLIHYRMEPRKKGPKKSVKNNKKSENTVGKKQRHPDDDDDEEDQFYYYCDKCSNKFNDWKELQKHKLDCVKVAKKFYMHKVQQRLSAKSNDGTNILISIIQTNRNILYVMNTRNITCSKNHTTNI